MLSYSLLLLAQARKNTFFPLKIPEKNKTIAIRVLNAPLLEWWKNQSKMLFSRGFQYSWSQVLLDQNNTLRQQIKKQTIPWAAFSGFTTWYPSVWVREYSRVPIRRGVWNKRSGTQDEKCIGRNISHMCLGLYSRCRFILTNLYLKVLHFDILIQLKDTAHFLGNVLGLIKGVCRINVPCLLIGTREYLMYGP